MNDLQMNLEAQKEMKQWNLNVDRILLKMTGKTQTPEKVAESYWKSQVTENI